MRKINGDKSFCYRITHINNLPLILKHGIVCRTHGNTDKEYIRIGNPEIIDVRKQTPVRIEGYGLMKDYVSFYFTPRSMMLYNIITGYRAPLVPRLKRDEIVVIRCLIHQLMKLSQWFFSDGQANDMMSHHYNDPTFMSHIDWESIQNSNFVKDDDYDRARRYQAEFLVKGEVPIQFIESINVYNEKTANVVNGELRENNINLAVNIMPQYFFK